ncbi:MAG: DMT family transporter [Clostridia bacterium]|nr:DMT family transporter [Clostridia bacterium]
MLLLSMIIYGSIGVFRKTIPLSSAALACFRGVTGAALLLLAAAVQRRKVFYRIGWKKLLWLALSGALIGFNWILLFEAFRFTTVATATLCYYMAPTIVVLLSPLVFGERITLKRGVCAGVSLLGMVFVSGFVENGLPTLSEAKGVLLGLGAALLYAAVVILNKKLPGVDAYEKTILQLLFASVALVPYLLLLREPVFVPLTPFAFLMLLIVGFVHTGVAYALYFGSMDGLRAQTVAVLSYLDPVTALLLSALVLRERLTVFGMIGAALILGAAAVGELLPQQKSAS